MGLVNIGTEYRFLTLRLRIDALAALLTANGIITKDEYVESLDLIKKQYEIEIASIEFYSRFERISSSGTYVDSDLEFFNKNFELCSEVEDLGDKKEFLESISYLYKHSTEEVMEDSLWK